MDCNTKQRQPGCQSSSGKKSQCGRSMIPDMPMGPGPMTWPDMPMFEPGSDVCPMRSDMRRTPTPPLYPDMMRGPVPVASPEMMRAPAPAVCPETMMKIPAPPMRPERPMACPISDMIPEMPMGMPGMDTGNCTRNKTSNMSELRAQFPVGMAYVPWQQWQELYTLEQGFNRGTIFPDLDLPFLMGRCW